MSVIIGIGHNQRLSMDQPGGISCNTQALCCMLLLLQICMSTCSAIDLHFQMMAKKSRSAFLDGPVCPHPAQPSEFR